MMNNFEKIIIIGKTQLALKCALKYISLNENSKYVELSLWDTTIDKSRSLEKYCNEADIAYRLLDRKSVV